MATGSRSELINVLGDVKARVQDKLGIVDFPMPQFILIGKQSAGKSRLCETLAGEPFNFISGTLGSRRPTVLEFRNVASAKKSRWCVRNQSTNQWEEHPVATVMQLVGDAHESLGADVSEIPVYVRLESANSVDMQIVDLPGFRDFAHDAAGQALSQKIEALVNQFMTVKNNVMLCVEQASDAATMSTLAKCRNIDPKFARTILIRNKLDKYYTDLTTENVNKWVDGFGDLPSDLTRFALTLPWWPDDSPMPKAFPEVREEKNADDIREMENKGLNKNKFMKTIGFKNFQAFMENKIEKMFAESINPVMRNLRNLKDETAKREQELETEFAETDPNKILSTTRDCGTSFATALSHVMEGVLRLSEGRMTLETELKEFHCHHESIGTNSFDLLPSEDFAKLPEYVDYLRNEIQVGAVDVEINGGAQFRRLMSEIEIYLRFSEIATETKKRDVIQARGVSTSSLTWRDVVVKLLSNEAHLPLQRRVRYVGERLKWFFEMQKVAVIEFMGSLEGTPTANMFSPLYPKHVKLIKQNEMIKHLVFQTYDKACKRQLEMFLNLFDNMLTTTFSNPWVFLRSKSKQPEDSQGKLRSSRSRSRSRSPSKAAPPSSGSTQYMSCPEANTSLPSFDDTKMRIPEEIKSRSGIDNTLAKWLQDIPTESDQIDTAVDKVQQVVLKTYSFIRSNVCDQVEMFAESFFKLPMMRRLEEDMAMLELSEEDNANYEARRTRISVEAKAANTNLREINACIDRLNGFKLKCEARGM